MRRTHTQNPDIPDFISHYCKPKPQPSYVRHFARKLTNYYFAVPIDKHSTRENTYKISTFMNPRCFVDGLLCRACYEYDSVDHDERRSYQVPGATVGVVNWRPGDWIFDNFHRSRRLHACQAVRRDRRTIVTSQRD